MGAEQGIEESPKIKNNIHTFRPPYISLPFAAPSPSEIFFRFTISWSLTLFKRSGLICVHWLGWNAQVSLELNRENSKTCKTTTWTHTSLVQSAGLACSAIPAARLEQLLYHWTTQRLPTIKRTKHFSKTCSKPYEKLAS